MGFLGAHISTSVLYTVYWLKPKPGWFIISPKTPDFL